MLESYLFVSNIVLMVVCVLLALVFLTLPLPKDKGLNNYKATLRVLSICYAAVSVFIFFELSSGVTSTDFISSVFLAISSSQAILFTISLNNLFNPKKITLEFVTWQCLPLILFLFLHVVLVPFFGYPFLQTKTDWMNNLFHPVVLLRELYLLFYIGQMAYYMKLFFGEEKRYNQQLNDYCADTASFRLSWVRYGFFSAIFVGILSVITTVLSGILVNLMFNIFLVLFYSFFALRFIQYPWIFQHIGKLFERIEEHDQKQEKENNAAANKEKEPCNWVELKQRIVAEKMYLQTGVTIDEIAQMLEVKRAELSGCINSNEKMNFNFWINKLRIEDAQQIMLAKPELSIAEIAEMVGYTEQSNFSRNFKQHTNLSPTQWRLEQK